MGEAVNVSGRTRGEYGRGLDLERVGEQGVATFVCPTSERKTVLLRNEKKYVVGGEVIKEKHKWAKFISHTWIAYSPEDAELMRKTGAFKKGIVKELAVAKQESKEAQAKRLKDALESDPELKALVVGLAKSQEDEPVVAPKKSPKKGATA